MPWKASDARQHTKKADTKRLREMWARIANAALSGRSSEGPAIRTANAAVARANARMGVMRRGHG